MEPRLLDGAHSILVIQFEPPTDQDVCSLAINALMHGISGTKNAKGRDQDWSFFFAWDRFHATQLTTWIGLGAGVPPKCADLIQRQLEGLGLRVGREHATIAHHELCPLLAVTNDAIEIPAHVSMVEEDDLQAFGAKRIVRRVFRIDLVELFKRDLMAKMMLGTDEIARQNFRFRYYEEQGPPTVSFGRLSLELFGQTGASYMAMAKLSSTPPCVLSFDFQERDLSELLSRLSPQVRDDVKEKLSAGTRAFRVPPGSAVVGIRCKRGVPEPDGVPFVVSEFLTPERPSLSIEF